MKKLKKTVSIVLAVIMTVLVLNPQRAGAEEFDPGFECGFTFQVDGWYDNAQTYYKVSCGDVSTGYVSLETNPSWNGAWFTIAPHIEELAILEDNYDDITLTFKIECGVADAYGNKKAVMGAWERYVDDLGNFHEEEVFSHVSETSDFVWEYTMDHVNTTEYHDYVVALDYENGGNPEIINQMQQNIFAYESKNYDLDSDIDDDDIKYALATEIYIKFFAVNSYEYFGLDRGEYSATAVSQLRDKITLSDAADTSMSNASGSAVAVTTKTATVDFGVSMFDGSPVSVTVPVYIVDEGCFVYNVNGTYYIRNVHNDNDIISFDGGGDNGFIIVTDNNISNVLGGGSGSDRNIYNTSAGLFSMDLNSKTDFLRDGESLRYRGVDWDYGTHVRVMRKTGTYVKIDTNNSDGENKQYDPLKLENGHYADDIWETGTGMTAIVFVGEKKINLRPLSNSVKEKGVDTISITGVRLADANQASGVSINTEDLSNITIEFLSNFYDSVKIIITYEGNIERELTIVRQGLVIDYSYLFDGGEGTDEYRRDCYNGHGPEFSYDYWSGEQIAVMATYYHPTADNTKSGKDDLKLVVTYADGTTEILNKYAHMSGSGYVAVDTTFFFLGFLPAHDDNGPITHQTFTRNGHTGAINAIVVNGGYDDPDTFGGTQIGSGKGVYWNGSVDWFN